MFSIASQPSRFGQLADYSLNEYIDLPKLTITEYDGHVQLKFDVNSFESILLMEHILKR
jgi:hypothetical protein